MKKETTETEQINKFRRQFKSLVYQRGLLTDSNNEIAKLSRWDKNGSHAAAIKREQDNKKAILAKIKELENGTSYEDWLKMSKWLTKTSSKYKQMQSKITILESELESFKSF